MTNEEYMQQLEQRIKEITTNKSQPCPSCGHCPTCGRSGNQFVPYYPAPYYQPYPWQPTITWATSDTNQA